MPVAGLSITRQISAAGIQPGGLAADNVLAVYSIPANTFDIAGHGVYLFAAGSFGATGNNKRIKIIVNPASAIVGSTVGGGGVTIADSGVVATNGGGWAIEASVIKYGAAGSNTQLGINEGYQAGAATPALTAPAAITATENAAILVAITGNASTALSDILFNFLEIDSLNS